MAFIRAFYIFFSFISWIVLLMIDGFFKPAVQKRGYVDLQDMTREENIPCCYGATLAKDPTCTLPCSWTASDPSTFLIRGKKYLEDRKKV